MTGYIDIHCHLIPGVDDGADSLETAVRLLEIEYKDGVRQIVLTPHYRRGMFECPMEQIHQQFARLQQEAAHHFPDMRLFLGCEFHVSQDMVNMLDQKLRPTMAGTHYVLAEFSGASPWREIRERVYSLRSHGYRPILAHVERCQAFREDPYRLEELRRLGAVIQVNAQSLIGEDGFFAKQFCKKLVKEDLIDVVGSDAHNLTRRRPELKKAALYLEKQRGTKYKEKILVENPGRILQDLTL